MPDMQTEAGAPLSRSTTPVGARARSARAAFLGVALTTVAFDQCTKWVALRELTPGQPVDLVGAVLRLNLIRNPGAAFSIGEGATWALTIVSLAVLAAIIGTLPRLRHTGWALSLGLLSGGAVGNLVDRFVREPGPGRGHVIDFIDYNGWFIGNVADIAIVVGAAVVMVLSLVGVSMAGPPGASGPGPT